MRNSRKKSDNDVSIAEQDKGSNVYHPYKVPPSIKLALRHLTASSVGKQLDFEDPDVCECCQNPCDIEPFDIFVSTKKFARYGIAYTILFDYILFMAVICLVIFLLSGLPFIYMIPNALNCVVATCNEKEFMEYYHNSSFLLHLLGLLCLMCFIVARVVFSHVIKKWESKLDQKLLKPNDFTLFIQGLDRSYSEEQIKNQLHEIFKNEDYKIEAVNKIYDITQFSKMIEHRLKLEKKFFKLKLTDPDKTDELKALQVEYEDLTAKVNDIVGNLEGQSKFAFSGSAFVILETEEQMHTLLEKYKKGKSKFKFQRSLKIKRAALPTNVIWDNYCLTPNEKVTRRVLSVFIAICLSMLTFGLLYAINKWEDELEKRYTKLHAYLTFIFETFVVYIVNQLLIYSLNKAIEFERRPTYSDQEISKIRIISTAQFFNTAIIILFANFMEHSYVKVIGESEVLRTIASIMIFEFLSEIFYFFFDIHYLKKLFKRKKIEAQLVEDSKTVKLFQFEVQHEFENPHFELYESFTAVFSCVAVALFYFPIFPFGLAIAALRLFCFYLMTKYKFIYRSKVTIEYEFEFSKKILRITEYMILYFCAGYVAFDMIFAKSVSAMTFMFLVIGVVQLFWLNFTRMFLPEPTKKKYSKITYSQAKEGFFSDYESENPVTKLSNYKTLIQGSAVKGLADRPGEYGSVFTNILKHDIVFDQPLDYLPIESLFFQQKNRKLHGNSDFLNKIPTNNSEFNVHPPRKRNASNMKRKFYNQLSDIIFEEQPQENFNYAPLKNTEQLPDQPLMYDTPLEAENSYNKPKSAKNDNELWERDSQVRSEKKSNKRSERNSVNKSGRKSNKRDN
jgi:hypothetical protein